MNNLQEHEAAWTRVHQILTEATSFETKVPTTATYRRLVYANISQYFALRVLERVINSQWNVLPEEQATGMGFLVKSLSAHVLGIRNFIVQMCIENSSSFEALEVGLLACLTDRTATESRIILDQVQRCPGSDPETRLASEVARLHGRFGAI